MSKDDQSRDLYSTMARKEALKHRWFLTWDRSEEPAHKRFQNRPNVYFFFQTVGSIPYKELVKRAEGSVGCMVDKIIYQKSDNFHVVISNDQSLEYVMELEHERIECNSFCDITLLIRPAGAVHRLIGSFLKSIRRFMKFGLLIFLFLYVDRWYYGTF